MNKKLLLPLCLLTYINDVRVSEGETCFINEDKLIEKLDVEFNLGTHTIKDLGIIFETLYSELFQVVITRFTSMGAEHPTYEKVKTLYKNMNDMIFDEVIKTMNELNLDVPIKYVDGLDLHGVIIPCIKITPTNEELELGFDISKVSLSDSTNTSDFGIKVWKFLYDELNK